MNIGLIAQTPKRILLENFCIAYKGILKKHTIYATELTALRVEAVTALPVVKLLPEDMGGCKQVESLIAREDLDMVIYFHTGEELEETYEDHKWFSEITRLCDFYSIPLATNIGTAESLILCLEHGDLEWRA
ncbi:MAG: methylglyoxal synthase [Lachnospiraceae bacterium]|nr:methylglyoxal synthase [Lachnospiraceae bacterium]